MKKFLYHHYMIMATLVLAGIAFPATSINSKQNYVLDMGRLVAKPPAMTTKIYDRLLPARIQPRPLPESLQTEPEAQAAPVRQEGAAKQPFEHIIHKAASTHKVDPALIKAIIMAESRYNPRAVSKRGAKGLMQLMPITAKSLGVEDSFDPEENINGGVMYFRRLLDRFDGDVELALAAYNAGSRYVRKYGGVPPFRQTRTYIHKVFKYHRQYKQKVHKTDKIV